MCVAFEVTGARYRNSTDYRIHAASLMGGAEIFIDGKGMHDFPASNQVQFEFTNEEYANYGPIFNAPTVSGKHIPPPYLPSLLWRPNFISS